MDNPSVTPHIKEWLSQIKGVRDAFIKIVRCGGLYVWGLTPEDFESPERQKHFSENPLALKRKKEQMLSNPVASKFFKAQFCCWRPVRRLYKAKEELEKAVKELDSYSESHGLERVWFTSPVGKLLTIYDLFDWYGYCCKKWDYPAPEELFKLLKEPDSNTLYSMKNIWPLALSERLKTHITSELNEQFDQVKRRLLGTPAQPGQGEVKDKDISTYQWGTKEGTQEVYCNGKSSGKLEPRLFKTYKILFEKRGQEVKITRIHRDRDKARENVRKLKESLLKGLRSKGLRIDRKELDEIIKPITNQKRKITAFVFTRNLS